VEILVILCLFIALAILASCFAQDSRDRLQSDEDRLGSRGAVWDVQADSQTAR
jgi:hypothetical protein